MLSTRLTIIALLAATWCLTSAVEVLHYDVACPGVNSELQCPEGQMINVTGMSADEVSSGEVSSGEVIDGEMSNVNCTDRKKPASVSNKDAFHRGMLQWVQLICGNLERCRLPKPDARMFVDDDSEDNFVQIAYQCQMKPAEMQTVVACENTTAKITCESGHIEIVAAKFGRFDENTCTTTPLNLTFSASYSAGESVKTMCDGKKDCSVAASSDVLGSPVPPRDLPMYLIVEYVCAIAV